MNIRSLEFFLKVYESGNMRLAAQKLYVSPQSVSQTILSLEAELQEKLFLREKRNLIPTRAAVKLKKHAEQILKEYQAIWEKGPESSGRTSLKIYCTCGILEYLGVEFVRDFNQTVQDILLYLVELPDKQALELFRRGEARLAILSDPCEPNLYVTKHLFSASYSYVVHPDNPLSRVKEISMNDLNGVNIVVRGDEFQLYTNQMSHLSRTGSTPNVVLETSSYRLSMEMAQANLAAALVPSYLAEMYAPAGTVVVPAKKSENEKPFYLVRPKNIPADETMRMFENFLETWILKHREAGTGM